MGRRRGHPLWDQDMGVQRWLVAPARLESQLGKMALAWTPAATGTTSDR